MGNPFSCCHPGRKEEDRGGFKVRDRLLHTQDSSTQTGLAGEEETYGSIGQQQQQQQQQQGEVGSCRHTIGEQAEARRGTAHSSSSSSSNGSYPAERAINQSSAAGTLAAAAAPTRGASAAAVTAAATADQGPAVASSGREPEGLPAAANGSAPAPAAPPPPPGHRSTGAMPRAHPNDQHQHRRQQQQATGGGGGGTAELRLGGRGGGAAQQFGGTAALGRGGGRFGTAFGAAGGGRGFAPKTVARAVPAAAAAAAGTVLVKYEMKEVLGVGSTSKCYRCVNRRSRKEFACKVIDKRAMDPKLKPLLDQFHVEIQVLQLLSHPNIIHMEDVFESDINIHMVMEIMQGGELFDYVVEKGTLSESEASVIVRKVTSALAYMHSLNIIHRDLKPENLLLTSKGAAPEVKIIDFGLAKVLGAGDDRAQSFLGTRGYLAPEMLQRESYNKEVDVWALGVIVFVLLCGCLPFDDDSKKLNRAGAFQKFVLRFPRWAQKLSPGAKDLLSKLLTVTPQARLTAKQALEHPWVTGKVAAADNYLESPRTLRKLRVGSSPKKGWGKGGGGGGRGGAPTQQQTAAAAAAAASEARRKAEFEEQSDEYREGGVGLGGGGRPRRKNSF